MSVPKDLRYTKEHEWVRGAGAEVELGITDFAQSELGDLVYVELPEIGAVVARGASFAVVESVKAASDVYAPLSGKVVARNESLTNSPELINRSPYTEGWLVRIEPSNREEFQELMDGASYESYLSGKK